MADGTDGADESDGSDESDGLDTADGGDGVDGPGGTEEQRDGGRYDGVMLLVWLLAVWDFFP